MGGSGTALTTRYHGSPSGSASQGGEGSPSELTTFETPEDVLYANELMRGKLWVNSCVVFSLGGLLTPLVADGPGTPYQYLLLAGSGVLLAASLFGLWVMRGAGRYTPGHAAPYGYLCNFALAPALVFFGWFSPLVLLIALGGVIFAMGHSTRSVVMMGSAAVAVHMSVGLASIFGILPQGTIASLNLVGLTPKLLCLAICEGMIVLAFVFGRRFRAHALLGLEAHARVVRDNARREALLEEAVEELNRVRRVGDPGRFTGLSIGSFDVGVVLGRGGMGEVYEAVHSTSGQPAALKVLAVAGSPDEQTVARFRREIMLAAQINDLHVVRVLEHSSAEASLLYLAMERLVGSSLAEELRDVRRPPVRVVLKMLQHVAQGVSAAHALGIVHRDLTPQNIFHHRAAGEDVWKILDFGIARWAGAESELTKNAIVGTPSYMSPEQVLGGGLDARSDLFSLGAVAYRCLTGRPAFHGAAADTMYHIVQDMPMQPSRLAALPPEVDLVLALVFAKAPEDRLDSALSFVEALTAALHGQIEPALEARAKQLLASKPWT